MSVDIPNFYGPALDGWLRVVDAVHEVGGKIMPQLRHVGMARNPAQAPSGAAERRPVGPDHARLPGPDPAPPARRA
jgi:2,4-dienoyl-CoA reductase-like NADH-dependent reductase (Old Yellow Enzyme family)